jgi:hypothetical protein
LTLFRGKADCTACHLGPNFSDEQFHNTGVAWRSGEFADAGRFAVSGREPTAAPSRPRRCARSPARRRTCTTAAWPRWRR